MSVSKTSEKDKDSVKKIEERTFIKYYAVQFYLVYALLSSLLTHKKFNLGEAMTS